MKCTSPPPRPPVVCRCGRPAGHAADLTPFLPLASPSYWEEAGNPEGIPVVFVHGGPGGGIEPRCRRFFDPAAYRIVLFSQRGCGASTPLGSVEDNTTWDLVSDMEALRTARGIDSWVVFGGSWGSTLSLAYAVSHAGRVRALVLRGIFTVRREEVDWFYERGGAGALAPQEFARYVAGLPEGLRGAPRLVDAFDAVLNGGDAAAAGKAALAWSAWEGATSYFKPPDGPMKYTEPDFAAVFARIECHYFKHAAWMEDGFLLQKAQIDKIRHIPATIVQGRWDIVCPIKTAHDLKAAFPEADLHVVESAGHSAFEAGTTSRLVQVMDRLRAPLGR